ncbi:hypothetical protein PIB30_111625, partial [Stylosanthes scabra]|nr:hypothetical protein [Stylosanthes scabra]
HEAVEIYSAAALGSKFKNFRAQNALYSNSRGRWQALPYSSWYGDMPIGVLKAVLYAQSASSSFLDQSFLDALTTFSKILLSSLFETSTCPLV